MWCVRVRLGGSSDRLPRLTIGIWWPCCTGCPTELLGHMPVREYGTRMRSPRPHTRHLLAVRADLPASAARAPHIVDG